MTRRFPAAIRSGSMQVMSGLRVLLCALVACLRICGWWRLQLAPAVSLILLWVVLVVLGRFVVVVSLVSLARKGIPCLGVVRELAVLLPGVRVVYASEVVPVALRWYGMGRSDAAASAARASSRLGWRPSSR